VNTFYKAIGTSADVDCGTRMAISTMTSRPYSWRWRWSRVVKGRGLVSSRQSEPIG
jgi:hypothetical protein